MTGEKEKGWNLILARVTVIFTLVTTLFIIICQVVMKMYFKCNKSVVKQRYKSVISFKILRIILGLFFIISAYVGLTFWDFANPKKFRVLATPIPFIIGLVGNAILLVYLTRNDEAWDYLMVKIQSFKERKMFDLEQRKLLWKRRSNKVFTQDLENVSQNSPNLSEVQNERRLENIQDVYVIDMENVLPIFAETSV